MTNNRSPAFTLIESLVVTATIGIMAAIAVPVYNGVLERAKATKDLINLRHIGTATQLYMNDNNGVFPGSATVTWMSQLEQNQKYLSAWRVLQSPFDKRASSEAGTGSPVSPISYGINSKVYSSGVAISADKITKPVTFIVFAPAQAPSPALAPWTATVTFGGTAISAPPGVTVVAGLGYPPAPPPNDKVIGGTHSNRTKINAMCGDWHVEMMPWSGTGPAFRNTAATGTDPDGAFRWSP